MGKMIVAHDISHGLNASQQVRTDGLRRRGTDNSRSLTLIIDDDLGRPAGGTVARPGIGRLVGLVALLCAGKVGAVLCFDASRLARNGRD